MDRFFIRSWWVPALRGLAGIAFGVLALSWPGLTLMAFALLFAAYALLAGGVAVAGAMRHWNSDDDRWLALLLGLASIGAGVVAVLSPTRTALLLVLVMGANALVTGVLDIVSAIRLRTIVEGELLHGLAGLASVVFGVLVFLFPGAGALALVWLVSMVAIVTGALLLALSLRMRALAHPDNAAVWSDQRERRVLGDRRAAAAR